MLIIERTVGHPKGCSMADRINHLEVLEPLAWGHARAVLGDLAEENPPGYPTTPEVDF